MAYVRLAPDDPARWNRPFKVLSDPFWSPGQGREPPGPDVVHPTAFGAEAVLRIRGARVEAVLARLEAIAAATARTRRIADDATSGTRTWVTRSPVFGFPDYTTVQVRQDGPDVDLALIARQRFGSYDFGVNAARLDAWCRQLLP